MNELKRPEYVKWIIPCITIIGGIAIVSNLLSTGTAIITGNLLNIVTTIPVMVFAILINLKFQKQGNMGKAWLFFFGATISWFTAESTRFYYEIWLGQAEYPPTVTFFYLLGCLCYLGFSFYFLGPVKNAITKKNIAIAILFATIFVTIPLVLIQSNIGEDFDKKASLALLFPILDSVMLIPGTLGIMLFFKGRIQFTALLLLIGVMFLAFGDLGFLYHVQTETYYTGHPADIMYYFAYLFFAFGVYDQLKIFQIKKQAQNTSSRIRN